MIAPTEQQLAIVLDPTRKEHKEKDVSQTAAPLREPSTLSLGRVAPLILILWALIDVGLRFGPVGWLNLEPAQAATRYPSRYAPFTPDLRVQMNPWVGELATMANLQPTETRSPMIFTTDSLGFRNARDVGPSGPRVVVMEGDSFTYGAALSDNETFPVFLSRQLGVPVYNAGRYVTDPERLLEMDWLFARIKKGPITVVYVLQELALPSLKRQNDQKRIDDLGRKLLGADRYTPIKDELRFANRFMELWGRISPLRITATRMYKALCDDRILPNPYRENVAERYLPGNGRFLFDHDHLNGYLHPAGDEDVREAADYLDWLKLQFQKRGADLWVLMIPEAASVYGPWVFQDESARMRREGITPFYDRLEKVLAARHIPAVNGLSVLRPLARADITARHLSYYREDHHWTPLGARRVATALATEMREAGLGKLSEEHTSMTDRSTASLH